MARRLHALVDFEIGKFEPVKTVLIVDNDLGFAFWLGQALDKAGDEAWPARSVPNAIELISQFNPELDLAIVEASLPSVSSFLTTLREQFPDIKIIAAFEESRTVPAVLDADLVLCKRNATDPEARREWMETIGSVFEVNSASEL